MENCCYKVGAALYRRLKAKRRSLTHSFTRVSQASLPRPPPRISTPSPFIVTSSIDEMQPRCAVMAPQTQCASRSSVRHLQTCLVALFPRTFQIYRLFNFAIFPWQELDRSALEEKWIFISANGNDDEMCALI